MNIPKILFVDNAEFHIEAEKALRAVSPVKLLPASGGEQALKILKAARPDLVFVDTEIPGFDAIKFCAAVKSDPALCSIPLLLITQIDRLDCIRAGFEAGCAGFIAKPLDKITFLEKVRQFLPVVDRLKSRINCQMKVNIKYADTALVAECYNLTLEGMFVKSKLKIKQGTRIELSFNLPGTTTAIQAIGRVVWNNNLEASLHTKMPIGFGIEIGEITGEGDPASRRKELLQFVKVTDKK